MSENKKEKEIDVGLLQSFDMSCVQKKKVMIGDNGDYFYNLAFSNGVDVLLVTGGKFCDDIELFHRYNLGFNFIDKKLKLVYKVALPID